MTNEHPRARDSSGTFVNYSQTKTQRIHLLYVVKNARVIDGGSGDGGGSGGSSDGGDGGGGGGDI